MTAKRSYYPGFLGALFLVLLRMAIGWHLLYEGLWKVAEKDGKPFSAEGYLRASAGPASEIFRNIVPDVDAKDRLRRDGSGRPIGLKQRWANELDRIAAHYRLNETQRQRAQAKLDELSATADAWFLDLTNRDRVQKYLDDVARVEAVEQNAKALTSQRQAARALRKEAESTRRELVAQIDAWTKELTTAWSAPDVISDEQRAAHRAPAAPLTQLDIVNLTTQWGLTIFGGCLILGLFTPLAALGAAGLLLLFYLSQPPFPGLPELPNAEGHYLYVNKNLIELIACLMIATTGSGRWIGLDALLFGTRRDVDESADQPRHDDAPEPPGTNPAPLKPERPRGSKDPRQPIPLG